jgi:hypothetical protein
MTISHETIKKGTEERSGRPATLKSTEGKLRRELPESPWLNTRVNTPKVLSSEKIGDLRIAITSIKGCCNHGPAKKIRIVS